MILKFQNETSLLLHLMWQWEIFRDEDMDKVNSAVMKDYFTKRKVKRRLTVTNSIAHNEWGEDVRDVAGEYIDYYTKMWNIQPMI